MSANLKASVEEAAELASNAYDLFLSSYNDSLIEPLMTIVQELEGSSSMYSTGATHAKLTMGIMQDLQNRTSEISEITEPLLEQLEKYSQK